MELDRRVQIRVALRGEDAKGFGTGYLVAPRLVLTADHVLDDLDPDGGRLAVTVCRPDDGEQQYPASVRWRQRDDTVDAALVEIAADCDWPVCDSLSDLIARPPQRYGHLIGSRSHPVSLTGFPRFQKDSERGRLDEHLEGQITPGTGTLAGRYEVTSTTPVPVGPPAVGGSRWSGISGAAVLAGDGSVGDLLCGVVRYDRQADGGTRLTATPISHLLTDRDGRPSEFRRLIAEHTGWDPVLEPIEPAPLLKPATADRDLDSPAALLRADTEAVAFHGRDQELGDLHAWCTTDPTKIAIQVITGPGGQGKTRLARHLTDTLSHEDWVTGHLRSDLTDHDTPPDLTPLTTALPLLLVVDYAETRPRLLRRLITHLHTTRHRVRLLLLARSDGAWRTDALSATAPVRRLLAAAPVVPLGPLQPAAPTAQDRSEAFRNAARDLALLLPRVPSAPGRNWTALAETLQPTDDLAHPRYDNALTLQLAALVTLLQNGPRPVHTRSGDPAEKILLEHEGRFWKDSADADAFELGLDTVTLKAAVAVAALCGAESTDAAIRVLAALPEVPAHKTKRTAAWLASLYPAERDRYWGSLQPDRVAEYHASQALKDRGIALPALLSAGTPGQQAQTITVLARAAIAHYNASRTGDSDNILLALDTALNATRVTRHVLQNTSFALPPSSSVVAALALRLSADLVEAEKQAARTFVVVDEPDPARSLLGYPIRIIPPNEAERAFALDQHGVRLEDMGRWAEGLAAAEQALEIWERLAADNQHWELGLANSLANLHGHLYRAGRYEEGVAAGERAVDLYRRLAADNPAHEARLANALVGLSQNLRNVERWEEGMVAAERAVGIYRRLAADNPAAHASGLANSLDSLGAYVSLVGRREEAVAAAEEAVDIYRRLAADDPAAHEVSLATSLTGLGAWLVGLGRWEEGLAAAEQSLQIWKRLPLDASAAYEPQLAATLTGLGAWLMESGQWEEGLVAAEQSLQIWKRLTTGTQGPNSVYEIGLAITLTSLGRQRLTAGLQEEAVAAAEQAVDIYRRLAADNPAHEANLGENLCDLGNCLSQVGRREEAVAAAEQAVDIYRRLAADDPAAHEVSLASSLAGLGAWLVGLGRWEEGLAAAEQSLQIWKRLPPDASAAYEPQLAATLTGLGEHLSQQGRQEAALAVTQKAVTIYHRLAADDPAVYTHGLAGSLDSLGVYLSLAGRPVEALAAAERAVDIYHRLAASDPAVHESDLAVSLANLSGHLASVKRSVEALAAAEQSLEIRKRLAASDPAVHEPDLAHSLPNLARYLWEAGRRQEALATAEQAVDIYHRLATDNPGTHESNLARSLATLALLLFWGEEFPKALDATQRATRLYRCFAHLQPIEIPLFRGMLGLEVDLLERLGRAEEANVARLGLASFSGGD